MVRKRRNNLPINSQLNFIIVLALAFFLIIGVAAVMNRVAIQTRAHIICGPTPTLPSQQCDTGWQFQRDSSGCPTFQCPAS